MTTIYSTTTSVQRLARTLRSMRRSWPRWRSWLATAAAPWTRTATISVASSSGRPTSASVWRRRDPHRALPRLDGPRTGVVDDRPTPVDGVRLLPLRPHRRAHRVEPRPVRPPTVGPPDARATAWTAANSAPSCSPPSASTAPRRLAVLLGLNGLRVSEACGTNVEDLGFERAIARCASSARATSQRASRSCRGLPHHRPGGRRTTRRPDPLPPRRRTPRPPHRAPWVRSIGKRAGLAPCTRTCCGPGSSWPPWTPESRCPRCPDRRPARRPPDDDHLRPPSENFDRHAAYIVVAFVAGG